MNDNIRLLPKRPTYMVHGMSGAAGLCIPLGDYLTNSEVDARSVFGKRCAAYSATTFTGEIYLDKITDDSVEQLACLKLNPSAT